MARVEFIPIEAPSRLAFLKAACQVAVELAADGGKVILLACDESQAREVDDLLWTFDESSFVPHSRFGNGTSPLDRIVVALDGDAAKGNTVLNLAPCAVRESLLEGAGGDVMGVELLDPENLDSRDGAHHKWTQYRMRRVDVSRCKQVRRFK